MISGLNAFIDPRTVHLSCVLLWIAAHISMLASSSLLYQQLAAFADIFWGQKLFSSCSVAAKRQKSNKVGGMERKERKGKKLKSVLVCLVDCVPHLFAAVSIAYSLFTQPFSSALPAFSSALTLSPSSLFCSSPCFPSPPSHPVYLFLLALDCRFLPAYKYLI